MQLGRTVFADLISHLSPRSFHTCVDRYRGNYKASRFSCWDQFLSMAFAQLTYRESLRDIEACLRALQPRLYHMGIRARIARSTLADANETRDWRIYADFAQVLITDARRLYAHEALGVDLAHTVYALDATIIDLCLTLFPWAPYTATQHAIKLHTLLDLRGPIPTVVRITPAREHDVHFLDTLIPEAGAFYLMDRGYLDFTRLYVLTTAGAFFVTRTKANLCLTRRVSRPADPDQGIRSDQLVVPTHTRSRAAYPAPLRRVHYVDPDTGQHLVFLTNHVTLPALTIAHLYRARWQVELFFKWIKQHLRIKAFYGTSPNAVKTQIWIAIAVYVLVAIVKKRLALDVTLHQCLQVLSVTLFEKQPISSALFTDHAQFPAETVGNQLQLLDL